MASVLIIGPHPDDQELGMGGTIIRLASQGHQVHVLDMTNGEPTPLGTGVTAVPGFPSKRELVDRYVERSGRNVEPLDWFQALALWKAAIFCEAIYGRFVRGELAAEDAYAIRFETGVPRMAAKALQIVG